MQTSLQTKREELARLAPVSSLVELVRAEIKCFGAEVWSKAAGVKLTNPEEPGKLKEHLGPLFDYVIELQFLYADRFLAKLAKDNPEVVADTQENDGK